jgi:hypothetical protein
MVGLVVTFITQVTAVVLLQLLFPPLPARSNIWSNRLIAGSSASHHAAFLLILAKVSTGYPSRSWSLEVLGSDSGGNRRGVRPLNVGGVRQPSCGAEGRVIEDRRIDRDQTVSHTIFNV